MISPAESIGSRACATTYHLDIVLNGTKPKVWRRLQVPANANLGWLHGVIQVAMGWTNSHLHQFRIGEACYSDTRHHFAEFEGDPEILEERKCPLYQAAPCEQSSFIYDYDFGDSWEHTVTVARILSPDPAASRAGICLEGAGACPPEDCGGLSGYQDLLKILKNRKHPEHETMKEWLGRPFDAQVFEHARANLWLRKLKWPNTTEAQLRKALMGRDGYKG